MGSLYLNNPVIEALERRLRALPGEPSTIPTTQEILNAVSTAPSLRALARARGWAVHALRRIDADPSTIIAMQIAAEAASQGRSVGLGSSGVSPVPLPEPEPEPEPVTEAVTHLAAIVTNAGATVTHTE